MTPLRRLELGLLRQIAYAMRDARDMLGCVSDRGADSFNARCVSAAWRRLNSVARFAEEYRDLRDARRILAASLKRPWDYGVCLGCRRNLMYTVHAPDCAIDDLYRRWTADDVIAKLRDFGERTDFPIRLRDGKDCTMTSEVWVALRAHGGNIWEIDGAAVRLGFFFEDSDDRVEELIDNTKWRFVRAESPFRVDGRRVRLSEDGKSIVEIL